MIVLELKELIKEYAYWYGQRQLTLAGTCDVGNPEQEFSKIEMNVAWERVNKEIDDLLEIKKNYEALQK